MQPPMPPGTTSAGPIPRPPGAGALRPPAQVAGLLICLVLIGVEVAWAVRDIRAVGLHDTLWAWLRLDGRRTDMFLTTGSLDLVLLVVLLGVLIASRRATVTWGYATAGIFALLYRLPGLWIFTADWTEGAPMRGRALATAIVFVAGGAALILIALAGRHAAAAQGAPGTAGWSGGAGASGAADWSGVPGGSSAPAVPGRSGAGSPAAPATGPAIAGGLLLVVLAVLIAGWEVYYIRKYDGPGFPPHAYKHLLTGEATITSYLAAPAAYGAWATVAAALGAAVAALRRVPLARPLGVAVGFLALADGVVLLDGWHAAKLLFATDRLPDWEVASQVSTVAQAVIGLLVLVLLAQRARSWPVPVPGPRAGWGPAAPAPALGPPPPAGMYGYPPASAGAPAPPSPSSPLTPPTPASQPHQPVQPPHAPQSPQEPQVSPASPASSPYQSRYPSPQQPGAGGGGFGPAPNLPPQLPLRPPPGTPPVVPPAGPRDSGRPDAGWSDSGRPDFGESDSERPDSGRSDAD